MNTKKRHSDNDLSDDVEILHIKKQKNGNSENFNNIDAGMNLTRGDYKKYIKNI